MAVALQGPKTIIKPRDGPCATRDDWVEEVEDILSMYPGAPDVYSPFVAGLASNNPYLQERSAGRPLKFSKV